ncbi:variable surface protein [Plasmodium gonderi]|uniref:Variable surface protein n=1 Tax=Plasmodium gonderi TaxID=77519 RepID=A0A1Y1JU41_PLAGO|nr:variable surface protein [Plasmodium gonderi]GAW84627.1 variable surface protein [Plasmodium gonderi]
MSKSIYGYINLFPVCERTKNSITKDNEGAFNSVCLEDTNISEDIKSDFNSICKNVLSYFNMMEKGKHSDNNILDGTCVYLHYWLYQYHLKEKNNKNIIAKKLCDALINRNNINGDPICENYKDFHITEDVLKKMKDLYDMNTNVNNLSNSCTKGNTCESANKFALSYKSYKSECESYKDGDFCKILDEYKNKYNSKIIDLIDDTAMYEILYSFQRNNIFRTIISVIAGALFILLFIFILYKFCRDISCLLRGIIRKKNTRNNIDEEWNVLTLSDPSPNTTKNRKHNISYHSA